MCKEIENPPSATHVFVHIRLMHYFCKDFLLTWKIRCSWFLSVSIYI